ncbi:sigma-54-dependent Fis family transcriptional regulator [bacterium]|nr:sigma-54-dependent Fis family transcriptional regulator [bacterium]RQV92216.1 MAG: sigma-54-dependent Fis family transcriptional regulator [bacterium]
MALRILVVDDEPKVRASLEGFLNDEGYDVRSCGSGEEGVESIEKECADVVLLDVLLPGMNGIEVLKKIKALSPLTEVLMISGHSDLSTAVRATKLGARNFFEKPLHPDHLLLELKSIADKIDLEKRVAALENLLDQEEEMIGYSEAMKKLKKAIDKAAPSDGRIFIFGENGTGKELVARAIHRKSLRKRYPFVSLNCAALPQELVESELFGYEKGAFTGAVQSKPGRFETADKGTLFLDEIGDMKLDTQAKLLRVLEENEAIRLGGNRPYTFDVRFIAATNKNLSKEIVEGRFREDLYYRLNVIPLKVVPLRERKEDIVPLSQYFIQRISEKTGKGIKKWGAGAVEVFQSYSWPGNVRELRNMIERLVIMSEDEIIGVEEVVENLPQSPSNFQERKKPDTHKYDLSFRERVAHFEKDILERGFQDAAGNVSNLARNLKIDRANLYRKLKSYGIK